MADLNKEEMSKYNQKLILQIIKLFPNSLKIKVTFENNRTTVKVNGSNAVVILYVNENINIIAKVFTVNFQGVSSYCYFDHSEYKIGEKLELKSYRSKTTTIVKYLIDEALNMPFCPEWRREMTPSNATQEEIDTYGWCCCWEGRFLEKHSYRENDKNVEWIDRCINSQIDLERHSPSGK